MNTGEFLGISLGLNAVLTFAIIIRMIIDKCYVESIFVSFGFVIYSAGIFMFSK